VGISSKDIPSLFPSKVIPRHYLKKLEEPARECSPLTIGTVLFCLDPSIVRCGWAIVRNDYPNCVRLDSGIFVPMGRENLDRFDHLANLIRQRLELAEADGFKSTDALIEVPAGGQRLDRAASQLMTYARAVGICEATCHTAGLDTQRVRVTTWKGMGKKARTQMNVKYAFKYQPRDDNEADALGLGLWLCSKTRRPT